MTKKTIYYIMGVSGCGKSTIGKLLAAELRIPFFDGDDYHPEANVLKMASGYPLNDDDRRGWLESLNQLAQKHKEKGTVIACSALKKSYRSVLQKDLIDSTQFVFLEGSFQEISDRLKSREGHFMPRALLQSQFDALEVPKNALTISIQLPKAKIVAEVIAAN